MAGRAGNPEFSLMNVVIAMTIDTLLRRIIESRRLVATRAVRVAVVADKRKIGEPMIEQHIFRPGCFVVALPASLAKLILVNILLAMTGVAICFQTDVMHRSGMAFGAINAGVPAQQREIRIDVMPEK